MPFPCFGNTRDRPQSPSPPPPRQSKKVIKATDVPQWKWDSEQSRTWMYLYFVQILGIDSDDATDILKYVLAFGPGIYYLEQNEWDDIVGPVHARSIYCHLVSVRRAKGAVPKNVRIGHGEDFEQQYSISRRRVKPEWSLDWMKLVPCISCLGIGI